MGSQIILSQHIKKAVDKENNLFIIENAVDVKLIEDFNKEDVSLYATSDVPWQEHSPRKELIPYDNSILEKIREQIIKKFECNDVKFWLDNEGFTMSAHIDNPAVTTVMQIYIGNASPELGTVFYDVTDEDVHVDDSAQKWHLQKTEDLKVRHAFNYKPNTGYYSINGKLQAHGLQATVSADDFRVSAYCYF